MVSGELFIRIGAFGGVNHPADPGNLGVVSLGHQPDGVSFREMLLGFFHAYRVPPSTLFLLVPSREKNIA